jgi:predicted transcriptional regulator
MKKKLSDMVFQRVSPPDTKTDLAASDLSTVLVKRLGLKRKESRAKHDKLLMELLKYRKDNIPVEIDKIAHILEVSKSQTYEEMRKWRTLGLIEFVKIPSGAGFTKGYMLTAPTVNRLIDHVESSTKSFFRKTRRIAKDFDDLLMLGAARANRATENIPAAAEDVGESENSEGTVVDEEEN